MSRLSGARKAVRPALKARVLLAGPSGSGKTRTGLIIATRLAEGGPILVIDTEKESALTYADDFDFEHVIWRPPYDPRELAEDITRAGATYAAVLVDSLSHFWRKAGGTLDIADGKFGGWKAARPAQEDLVEAVLDCKAHVILCCRAVEAHVQETENGRTVVRKLGLEPQQDSTLMYEMNVGLEIDMDHRLTVSKSRSTSVPVGKFFHPGHAGDFADVYSDWLKGGEPPAAQTAVDDLVARMNELPPEPRKAAKEEFMARFGRPEHLPESALVDATALVAGYEHDTKAADAAAAWATAEALNDPAVPIVDVGGGGPPAEPEFDVDGDGQGPPPAAGRPVPANGLRKSHVGSLAGEVFAAAGQAAPAKAKSRVLLRLRHAAVWAATSGRDGGPARRGLTDCEPADLPVVWAFLEGVEAGAVTWEADPVNDDGGATFTDTIAGRTVSVRWADLETDAAPAAR